MFLMKASEKTNGLNAYVSGMGPTKRFVVWDTTADRMPDDEVMFVFGHESGHYVLHHIVKGLADAAVGFSSCSGRARGLRSGWCGASARAGGSSSGERAAARHPRGFLILILVRFGRRVRSWHAGRQHGVSRHFEHQADVYGQEAIHGLVADPQKTAVSGFNHLGEAWLEDPEPNPFIEFWLYNHPSVQNRANFAAHYDPWANGGHGEFFKK